MKVAATTAAAAANPAPTNAAAWNADMKADGELCFANTKPSNAVAIKPAMRAVALLKPEATPTRSVSTDAMTEVVSGATHRLMPSPTINVGGNISSQ